MIYIYSDQNSARLQYTLQFVFEELLNTPFRLLHNQDQFSEYKGAKINYANHSNAQDSYQIGSFGLLFEEGIRDWNPTCFKHNDHIAFFKTENDDLGFDLFSAVFYLISRYEEYLPHKKDIYGRYAHENSLAFKQGFLQIPLVNIWIKKLAESLKQKFPEFQYQLPGFSFCPTYDIDIAWSYRNKGWMRNVGGFWKNPGWERLAVFFGFRKDPFDCYDWLHQLHNSQHELKPIYFFLLAEKNGRLDKNILPNKKAMRQLVREHSERYSLGIHPSWQSGERPDLIMQEIFLLQELGGKPVRASRQHYIRFNLPETFRQLIKAGITDEYSMGYGSINGFRASVAHSFYWFDLLQNETSNLRIHPFCFMDANSYYEQKQTALESEKEFLHYYNQCREHHGQLITIFHNHLLGSTGGFDGCKEMYESAWRMNATDKKI